MDFLKISMKSTKKDRHEIYPSFIVRKSKDLMIRGGDFYAIWDEENGKWSTEEDRVIEMVDQELRKYKDEHPEIEGVKVMYMSDSSSRMIEQWHRYVQRDMRDNFHPLDEKLVFANSPVNKKDYASKSLPYSLCQADYSAWDELVSTLYDPIEKHKIEWAIGSIVNGDSKELQKFLVFYGSAGTGKSTILNIVQKLFDGYYTMFDAKALGSNNESFALEPFKTNPLVAIQHDGDLSRIEDNTRLNSVVSHEPMTVNEKYTKLYVNKFHAMLFMGTNRPVKITDSKSGILRRLIDVSPSGRKLPVRRYNQLMSQINFELGGIADHCKEVYEDDKYYYDDYVPSRMISSTNDIYNFMEERVLPYNKPNIPEELSQLWPLYKSYCEEANISYPVTKRVFKEELKSYFEEFQERGRDANGNSAYNLYKGLKLNRFIDIEPEIVDPGGWLDLKEQPSIFDEVAKDYPAQYASENEAPSKSWKKVKTKLCDLDTSKLHYVNISDINHIVIDFDLKNSEGEKSFRRNANAAEKFPRTYAEVSKGGQGLHLHYYYDGDPLELSRIYDKDIEVKVFNGDSSLRRRLSKCNDLQIAHINSGLPLKEQKVVNYDVIKNEKQIRTMIRNCLNKTHHGATAPEVDFINHILEEAYESGIEYDVSDMKQSVANFAMKSTNQAQRCIKTVSKMHFMSESKEMNNEEIKKPTYKSDKYVFFDVEVFPNLFIVCWKFENDDHVNIMINPTPAEVAELFNYKLIGYNNRRYDNHILYARALGYTNLQLFMLSQRIVDKKDRNAFFREAYNISETDIFDYSSKKQSLKKWEIELGEHHQELGLKWDEPVPEELWQTVAEYCVNDVKATEAVFHHLKSDFEAREILSAITGLPLNSTTNQHTTYLIVGNDKDPQSKFVYTDLRVMFPGYTFENGKSMYKGEEVGEGGYVYAEPGIYHNVALLDIASMHPSSAIALNIFGPYTKNFEDLVKTRLFIKHGDYDAASKLFDGKLKEYLTDKAKAKSLSGALKIAINSVYGLTAARFDNKLRDPRNVDNIVAKRGALFMIDLKEEVQKRGYTVAHIKTDSIKIPEADEKIIKFVTEFGKKYGYTFEHEATYDRMCLVNDAVYIAKYASREWCEQRYGYIPEKNEKKSGKWDATGTQFQVPFIFKTLFSHEPIEFKDKCETKTTTSAFYLDMNENLNENEHDYQFIGKTGSFCPIKSGCGGGLLMRLQGDKYYAATGTKGYRWLESETVKNLNKESDIDESYYRRLVDDAIDTISKYGDIEQFIYG